MLVTVTPGAQLDSAAWSAARPCLGHAVPIRGRDSDHESGHQPGQDAEERTLHAGERDDHGILGDRVLAIEEAPKPGDTDIGEESSRLAVERQGTDRFSGRSAGRLCLR